MKRVVDVIGDYKIIETSHGKPFVVIKTNGLYENHSHFTTEEGARKLIDLLMNNIMPQSNYMREAAYRLIGDEADSLRVPRKKDKYFKPRNKDRYENSLTHGNRP